MDYRELLYISTVFLLLYRRSLRVTRGQAVSLYAADNRAGPLRSRPCHVHQSVLGAHFTVLSAHFRGPGPPAALFACLWTDRIDLRLTRIMLANLL
jgi:hypothetical protein